MGKENIRASRRARTSFSAKQLDTLEKVFLDTQYPDAAVLDALAEKMGLDIEKLCTWFQNRRSKFRKESKKGHMLWMRTQLFSGQPTEKNIMSADFAPLASHVLSTNSTIPYGMQNGLNNHTTARTGAFPPYPCQLPSLPLPQHRYVNNYTGTDDVTATYNPFLSELDSSAYNTARDPHRLEFPAILTGSDLNPGSYPPPAEAFGSCMFQPGSLSSGNSYNNAAGTPGARLTNFQS